MNRESEKFRRITMKVLTMELNSITIMDLVAYGGAAAGIVLAVLAFRDGSVQLDGALFILLLAADFFLPMRLLGSYFHIAMNGMAASEKIFRLLDAPEPAAGTQTLGRDVTVRCENPVSYTHLDVYKRQDLNYRGKLWTREEARAAMTDLCQYVDVCISNEEDVYKRQM